MDECREATGCLKDVRQGDPQNSGFEESSSFQNRASPRGETPGSGVTLRKWPIKMKEREVPIEVEERKSQEHS